MKPPFESLSMLKNQNPHATGDAREGCSVHATHTLLGEETQRAFRNISS